jgi:uncharacterized membrane protein (UPF0127 family)
MAQCRRLFLAMLVMLASVFLSASGPAVPLEKITLERAGKPPLALEVEVARTEEERFTGLMGRTHLAPAEGMLFLLPETQTVQMWMKDTPLALDMLFIDAKGRVADIHTGAVPNSTDIITSDTAVKAVLELPAGSVNRWNIHQGDKVRHAAFH